MVTIQEDIALIVHSPKMKAASPVIPHSPRSIFGIKLGENSSSFDMSQHTFFSALLQIKLRSLPKIDIYSELDFPFSFPTFLNSSSFERYEAHDFRGRHVYPTSHPVSSHSPDITNIPRRRKIFKVCPIFLSLNQMAQGGKLRLLLLATQIKALFSSWRQILQSE